MDTNHIIPVIAYFDMFDYPLTQTELNKWQFGQSVRQALGPFPNGLVEQTNSFYHLTGRSALVQLRHQRYLIAEKKFKRALRFAQIFRLLSSVRLIAVCNTLAFSNARDESDIDLFIVTSPNKIWLTRFWLQSLLALLGIRPHDHGVSIKDAVCLSFLTTEDNLNLQPISLNSQDVYLPLWISQLVPIYDPDGLYQKFWQVNSWIKKFLPQSYPLKVAARRQVKKTRWSGLFSFLTAGFWEQITKKWQNNLFPRRLKEMANRDRRVIINDKMLKLHTNDRLQEFQNQWLQKLKNLK